MTTEQVNDPLCHCKHHESSHHGSCNECICSGYWHFTEDETEQKQDNSNTAQQEAQEPNKVEQEVSASFIEASFKLDKIESYSNNQKSEIIQLLAVELEGKIATDEIANEIVEQLCRRQKKVSERLVRHCLNEKYKKKHRVDNAKKQKVSGNVAAKLPKQSSLTDRDLLRASELKKELEPIAQQEVKKSLLMIVPTTDGKLTTIEETAAGTESKSEDLASENETKTSEAAVGEDTKFDIKTAESNEVKEPTKIDTSKKQEVDIHEEQSETQTQESKKVTSNEEDVIESEFRLDWDELSNLFVPNMDKITLTIKTCKGKIVSAILTNKLGDSIELKNGGGQD